VILLQVIITDEDSLEWGALHVVLRALMIHAKTNENIKVEGYRALRNLTCENDVNIKELGQLCACEIVVGSL
jgi:hypothetical protein